MSLLLRLFLVAAFLAFLVAGGIAAYGYRGLTASGPSAEPTTVVVPSGTSVARIAQKLAAASVIEDPLLFRVGVRLLFENRPLQAGEYLFPAGISPRGAIEQMIEGRRVQRKITIAEGLTNREILDLLAAEPALEGALPDAEALGEQGQFLPETYFFMLGDKRAEILERMRKAMTAALDELWPGRRSDPSLETPRDAVILASIVEKETALAAEQPRIAAVFFNRLRIAMPLQSDPTVIYALTQGKAPLGRLLTRADLTTESPYNTYVANGLPPAPITNPGRSAIAAVLQPAQSDEFYFVADGTGGHVFAKTMEEHLKNVAAWRRISAEQKKEAGEAAP
jgi:UPF0755 protein